MAERAQGAEMDHGLRQAPRTSHQQERDYGGFVLPSWMLGALGSAIVAVAGLGVGVWANDGLQEQKITANTRINERQDQTDKEIIAEINTLRVEIATLKRDQDGFQNQAIERLDTMLERDRFRRR